MGAKKLFKTSELRLRSGALISEGRVEVKQRNTWGTICDDHWTLREANTVCRSLGFGSAAMAAKNAYFGRGLGEVGFDNSKLLQWEHPIVINNHFFR